MADDPRLHDRMKGRPFVPCHDELYGLAVALLPFPREAVFRVAELGGGSGHFAAMIARAFPRAQITLIDADRALLAEAGRRLDAEAARCSFVELDWTVEDLPGPFDAVVSALSVHRLDPAQRADLYEAAHAALGRFGLLLNVDRVRGATAAIEHAYRAAWRQQMEAGGADPAAADAALSAYDLATPGTLQEELEGLARAGFADANCWYKNLGFAVMSGVRAA